MSTLNIEVVQNIAAIERTGYVDLIYSPLVL